MTKDPLEKHHGLIAVAERGQLEGHAHVVGLRCIADLAAALRVSRARVAELEGQLNPPCPDPSIDAFYLEADKGG